MNRLRGILPVLQTPFDDLGAVDDEALARQVDFVIACGAHGLVYPVLASEFQYLTDGERRRLVERVVRQADGRAPVIIGVAATTAVSAAEYAAHAAQAGADAVIALPPYLTQANRQELIAYYAGIAQAARRPVVIQHSFAGMDATLLSQLLTKVEHIHYIKEEMAPSAHYISQIVRLAGETCWGVFGGGHGRWMLSEMRRGATGFMPSAELVDVYVQIWDAFQSADASAAQAIFNQLLPAINLMFLLPFQVCKQILVRRGVIATARMRQPGHAPLDEDDLYEIERILEELRPLLRV